MSKLDIRIEPVIQSAPAALPDPLGFGRYFTSRMFTQYYTTGRGWHDAVIGPYRPLALDRRVGCLPAGAAIPVSRIGQVAFDAMQVCVDHRV